MSKPSVVKSFQVRYQIIHGGYASAQCKMLHSILQEFIPSTFNCAVTKHQWLAHGVRVVPLCCARTELSSHRWGEVSVAFTYKTEISCKMSLMGFDHCLIMPPIVPPCFSLSYCRRRYKTEIYDISPCRETYWVGDRTLISYRLRIHHIICIIIPQSNNNCIFTR